MVQKSPAIPRLQSSYLVRQFLLTCRAFILILFSLSEYGCQAAGPRKWNEIAALYSEKMTGVYSGGLVYEYTMESNNYGIVQIKGDAIQELADFSILKKAFATTPMPAGDGGYKQNLPPSMCPAESHPNWPVKGTAIPRMPEAAKKFFQNGAGAGVGIKGAGSQTAGTPSPGWSDGSGEGPRNNVKPSGSAPGTSTKATAPVIVVPPSTSVEAVSSSSSLLSVSAVATLPQSSTTSNVDVLGAKEAGSSKKNSAAGNQISLALSTLTAFVMLRLW